MEEQLLQKIKLATALITANNEQEIAHLLQLRYHNVHRALCTAAIETGKELFQAVNAVLTFYHILHHQRKIQAQHLQERLTDVSEEIKYLAYKVNGTFSEVHFAWKNGNSITHVTEEDTLKILLVFYANLD